MSDQVQPGMIVRDERGNEGIVAQKEPCPSTSWLDEQINPIPRDAVSNQWWGVLTMHGGYILAPDSLLVVLRHTSYEDFLEAVEQANVAGRKSLAHLFPEYVSRAVNSVQSDDDRAR